MSQAALWKGILVDAFRAALARPVSTSIGAFVIAAVCLVTLMTTGRTAATEAQVIASIDSVGTRLITITDTTGNAGIDPGAPEIISQLEGVSWAFGIGPAVPATNPAIGPVTGDSISARALIGDLPTDASITQGRSPAQPGEAVVGDQIGSALFLSDVAGTVDVGDDVLATVGEFAATGPLEALGATVLYLPRPHQDPPLRYLYALAEEGVDVTELAQAVEALVPAHQPDAVEVDVPTGAIELRETISGTLGAAGRQLMAIVLGTGLVLVAATTAGTVTGRRRDFGRQRALGATRLQVVVSVLVHSGLAGLIGTIIGLTLGLTATWALTGALPSLRFCLGLAGLTIYVTLLGSIPPAVTAALRDPVRILRVP